MPTYAHLNVRGFYLIIEKEGGDIKLLQPIMETNQCLLLINRNADEHTFWRKKSDPLFEIIDELTDEQLAEYENFFENIEGELAD